MTDEDKAGNAAAFLRQRRNLILGSVALIFVEAAELRLKPDLALLGVSFHVEHPEAMVWLLWIAVFYWALRYYQYQHVIRSKFARTARDRMLWKLTSFLQSKTSVLMADEYADRPKLAAGETAHFIPLRPEDVKWSLFSGTAKVGALWVVRVGETNTQQLSPRHVTAKISAWPLWLTRVGAYGYVAFRTPEFTEQWLPYLLFASALLVKVHQLAAGAV